MTAHIIDGVAIAKRIKEGIATHTADIKKRTDIVPGLAVVLVGEDPASQVYVRNKGKACEAVGFKSYSHILPQSSKEEEVLALVKQLNRNPNIHGILVQLPLPDHINEHAVINAIDPIKDVDGFHPVNVGRLATGLFGLAPCTPSGCMILINEIEEDLSGKRALVIGRSNIVGKPMASFLLRANCTVTIAHSRTHDLERECLRSDIVVSAIGRSNFVKGEWIKPGAIVIDVGINREESTTGGKDKLVGDVEFDAACARVKAITPVPGGVGPMTIACLLQNTLQAAMLQNGWGLTS